MVRSISSIGNVLVVSRDFYDKLKEMLRYC